MNGTNSAVMGQTDFSMRCKLLKSGGSCAIRTRDQLVKSQLRKSNFIVKERALAVCACPIRGQN